MTMQDFFGFFFSLIWGSMERIVAVIDLKSFYASVECAVRHLDPFKTPLAVVDPYRGENTVVMSATPYLKEKYKVPNVCRKKDLPKAKGLILAVPRMELYLRVSSKVVSIFLDYVSEEDLHVYSVDESFLDLSPYLSLYGSPEGLVKKIQKEIKDKLSLIATAGIAPNPFLAKVALDLEGKKRPPYLASWTMEDVQRKLWKVKPIDKIWGISHGIKSHLERIGIKTLYELAHAEEKLLVKEFGIMGYQLKDLANGIDGSIISEKYVPISPSLSYGQTLYRPYGHEEGKLILREIVDEQCHRLRRKGLETALVSLFVAAADCPPYSASRSLSIHTQDPDYLYEQLLSLYENAPSGGIFNISIAYGKLRNTTAFAEFSFLSNPEKEAKNERLYMAMDLINDTFGNSTVLRATSLLSHSMVKERHDMIGGHKR